MFLFYCLQRNKALYLLKKFKCENYERISEKDLPVQRAKRN
jgi:hypothetical protein